MRAKNFGLAISVTLGALTCAHQAGAALVGHWVADDLTAGGLAAPWVSQVGSWEAVNEGNAPTVVANAIGSGGRNAVQFGNPPLGGLQVDAAGVKNPLVGLTSWSATVVFQTSDAAAGGGGNTSPGAWWQNGALIGIELGGGNRGDWAIWLTDGNATGGAKLGASRGNPDAGVFSNTVVNDGAMHVVTATYELSGGNNIVSLYLDGVLAGTNSVASAGVANDAVENEKLRFGSHNNFGFYKGLIGEIQLDDSVLTPQAVAALHSSLNQSYNVPEPASLCSLVMASSALLVLRRRRRT